MKSKIKTIDFVPTKMLRKQLHNIKFRIYLKEYIRLSIEELHERNGLKDELIPAAVVINLTTGKFDDKLFGKDCKKK